MATTAEHEDRFRGLFDTCYRPVLAYALRRAQSRASAEDVVEEAFLVAWRRIGDVPAGEEALPWLLGVARRVLANDRRGGVRRDRLLGMLRQHRTELVPDVEERFAGIETEVGVREALGRIRPADAEVLQLVAWEGLTHAQIAVVLGCSVNAVAIRVHRARANLRRELGKGGQQAGHPVVTPPSSSGEPSTEWSA